MVKKQKRLRVKYLDRCIGCLECVYACARTNEKLLSNYRSAISVKASGGIERNYVVVVCRGCTNPPCVPACPIPNAISARDGGGVIVDRTICDATKCNQECVQACPIPGAIHIDPDIKKAIVCRQCGACVQYCSTGVLVMEEPSGDW